MSRTTIYGVPTELIPLLAIYYLEHVAVGQMAALAAGSTRSVLFSAPLRVATRTIIGLEANVYPGGCGA
jgi:hypothetical protein